MRRNGKTLIPSPLFHYTCHHGEEGILADGGKIRPGLDGVVWLTDMQIPNRSALGLTRNFITCDRTAFRFRVDSVGSVMWWPEFRRHAPQQWRDWAEFLEMAPDVRPAHWYVSETTLEGIPE